jgi:F0F1-type ATP synthase assembly protein I
MVKPVAKTGQAAVAKDNFAESMYQRGLFLNLALNMSWQLAIVVIVPIVGGHMLDGHFNTTPWLTIVGAVVAAVGVIAILRLTVKEAAVRISTPKTGGHK